MPIHMKNCCFEDVATIVKSDGDTVITIKDSKATNITDHAFVLTLNSDLNIEESSFNKLDKSVVYIHDVDFLDKIGLSHDTNIHKLRKLLLDLKEKPENQQRKIISDSFLSRTNNLTTITTNILQILPYLSF